MIASRSILALSLSLALQLTAEGQSAQPVPAPTQQLIRRSCFDGTGGPNGDFDWVVHSGEVFFLDTTLTTILGGPNGSQTTTEDVIDGVVDVRNLTIEAGGEIRVQGPNPVHVLATGDVIIRGTLDLSGFNAKAVATLNTGNQVEIGAAGAAGGGRGGNGNIVTTSSSPRGEDGQGPFHKLDAGGQGGETGYAPAALGKDARRPGGGGGGRFARNGSSASDSSGNDGNPLGKGAVSGVSPAQGGAAGFGPFVDTNTQNDFFGTKPVVNAHGRLVGFVRGELPDLWAGYGGGGGGNADPASTFPTPGWNFASDEKGGAGGGGGGALQVQALGRVVFGAQGQILANGGRGATGENTNFLDHIGGTGGGGSGGHVVLESATGVDFTDGGTNTSALPRNWVSALGPPKNTGPTGDVNACCRTMSNGGAGGPGVIELHVLDPISAPGVNPVSTDIVVPTAIASAGAPLELVASPPAFALFPSCGGPFARERFGWSGAAGRTVTHLALDDALPVANYLGEDGLEFDAHQLEVPRRF